MFKYNAGLVWADTIFIEPVPKQSTKFRAFMAGGKPTAMAYIPADKKKYQADLVAKIKERVSMVPLSCPVGAVITFLFKAPAERTNTKKKRAAWEARGSWGFCTAKNKGDFDNLMKPLGDSMNELTYDDDSLICDGRIRKFEITGESRIEIKLYKLEYLQENPLNI